MLFLDILGSRAGSVSSVNSGGTLRRKNSAPAASSMSGRPLPPTPTAEQQQQQQLPKPILTRSVSLATSNSSTPNTVVSEQQSNNKLVEKQHSLDLPTDNAQKVNEKYDNLLLQIQ